ncbi:sulfite exporter TauE/SafE family protein [Defluviitalea phaphyphila]|uniref:sulfite exporter TauE/SafE family protein n=1 Tax=Defluviitalea phaphyphila TaxID=1473580 RepID=UPI000730B1FC|nr:sulfite exporter TauE/SafE family protein [Defluviitalea phaphyphila]
MGKIKIIAVGFVTGMINGLFGAGGGSMVVPAMEKFLDVKEHEAHATAIAVILPLSIISTFIYVKHQNIVWESVLYVSIGGIIGGILGAKFLKKLSPKWLHKIFGLFMIAASIRMII